MQEDVSMSKYEAKAQPMAYRKSSKTKARPKFPVLFVVVVGILVSCCIVGLGVCARFWITH